jgi:hypothetical protein
MTLTTPPAAAADPDQPPQAGAAGALTVPGFLATAGTLTLEDRKLIVDQARVLLEQNYVHLPLKSAMHAVSPVQRLRLVRARLNRQTAATMEPEWQFHREMASIFMSVRDLHTNYLLPQPFAGQVAFLPFMLEKASDAGVEHYVVTRTVAGFTAPGFGPGAEVTHWNGVPIARAVEVNGARFAGSNRAANLARGLDSLTVRPLKIQLPPDEDWIDVTYTGTDAQQHELRVTWQVAANLPPMTDLDAVSPATTSLGLDLDADERSRAVKMLYKPDVVDLEGGQSSAQLATAEAVNSGDVATTMPGVFRARPVTTASGTFGHLRIFTFSVQDPVAFRDEFVRLAAALPQAGLIVDVRGNGGGHLHASEFTLQTLTPRRIEPEPVQFLATALNLALVRRHKDNTAGIDLGPWLDSLDQATETGAAFSAARPITPVDGANEVGQTYHGPVVLVTDARCYSATDFFAAGWADHGIGPILGVDVCTGAGGANVWTLQLLQQLMAGDPASPYKSLPQGANMRVSIRRGLRVGALAGTPVEDLGVVPDTIHPLTRDDVLAGNTDLLDKAGAILAALPVRRLDVSTTVAGGTLTVELTTEGVDRVDVYLDGRPVASPTVTTPVTSVTVAGVTAGQRLRADGFSEGRLVASRRAAV